MTSIQLFGIGLACIVALALWKATSERWIPTIIGWIIITGTLSLSKDASFPFGFFIFVAGVAIFELGRLGLKKFDKSHFSNSHTTERGRQFWCVGSKGHSFGNNEPYRVLPNGNTICLVCLVKNTLPPAIRDHNKFEDDMGRFDAENAEAK